MKTMIIEFFAISVIIFGANLVLKKLGSEAKVEPLMRMYA